MAWISIEEISPEGQHWSASVRFDHGPKYPVTIHDPFSPEQEEELEWYFEEHLRFPFTKQVKARRAAASIQTYGEQLFDQIFADRHAYSAYKECLQAGLRTLQIEVAGSPAIHALHWEALKDPDLPHPLSLQVTMVRKNLVASLIQATVRSSPTINLLIVTARPSGKHDVGYRTISRPMVEALGQAGIPVQIEVLRPGTYEALDKHLRETTTQKGVGYYQVIHFDVHGAVLSYQELQHAQQAERYLYQQRYGRPDLQSYEEDKAFLFFEEKQDQKADPVEASELAALLLSHQIPIAILNACQSGKQIGASETSLGSRLMQAGVQMVLAMGYSVTVSAAELMMRTLYQQLFARHELSATICTARQAFLAKRLRAERHLVVLDNLESITGEKLAIQHTLSRSEQEKLHQFLIEITGGRTLMLLGSRGGEAWLAKETCEENVYELAGLDPEAASFLADRVLERNRASRYRQDGDLLKLLNVLDGFPLALEVILANLARQTPTQVLDALQLGEITLQAGNGQDKTENILRCVDYSYSNLSPEGQSLLMCLAPFTSVLFLPTLDTYVTALKQQPALASLPWDRWQEVIEAATNWGLLTPDADLPAFLRLQPVLPYFLRTQLSVAERADMRKAIETAFRELYEQLGPALRSSLNSKEPQEKQLGQALVRLEYENLSTATRLALDAQVSILGPYSPLSNYIDGIQAPQQGLLFAQHILTRLNTLPAETLTGPLGVEISIVLDDIARWQIQLKQYADAEESYQRALTLWLGNISMDADTLRKRSASLYHQLGVVAQEQRQWEQAQQYYQQALELFVEYRDQDGSIATLYRLAQVWKATNDTQLPGRIAAVLNMDLQEGEQLLKEMLKDDDQDS